MGNMNDWGDMQEVADQQRVDFPLVVSVSSRDLFSMLETIDFYANGGNDGGVLAMEFLNSTPDIDIPEV